MNMISAPLSLLVYYGDPNESEPANTTNSALIELEKLKACLKPLQDEGVIRLWVRDDLGLASEVGEVERVEIVILLITSPYFMSPSSISGPLFSRLLARWAEGGVTLIPIFLKAVEDERSFSFLDTRGQSKRLKLKDIDGAIGKPDRPLEAEARDREYSNLSTRIRRGPERVTPTLIIFIGLAVVSAVFAIAAVSGNEPVFGFHEVLISCAPALFLAMAVGLWVRKSRPKPDLFWMASLKRFRSLLGVAGKEVSWEHLFAYFVAMWLTGLVTPVEGIPSNHLRILASISAAATTATVALTVHLARSLGTALLWMIFLTLLLRAPAEMWMVAADMLSFQDIRDNYIPILLIHAIALIAAPLVVLRSFRKLPWGLPIAFVSQALITGIRASEFDKLLGPSFRLYVAISVLVAAAYTCYFCFRLVRVSRQSRAASGGGDVAPAGLAHQAPTQEGGEDPLKDTSEHHALP